MEMSFGQNLAIYLMIFPGFLYLGAISLKYYVSILHPSKTILQTFLSQLSFPLNIIYAKNSRYNFITTDFVNNSKDVVEYLMTASSSKTRIERLAFATVLGIVPLSFLVGVTKTENPDQMIVYGFWFIVTALSIAVALRFGHNLRNTKGKLDTPISPKD